MLDLDVGFLADPRGIVKTFNESPDIDIFVQVISFIIYILYYRIIRNSIFKLKNTENKIKLKK